MKFNQKSLKLAYFMGFFLACFTTQSIAEWYNVKIMAVAPRVDTGDSYIQIKDVDQSDTDFDHFGGIQRCIVYGDTLGAKTVVASLLTALAINTAVIMNIDGVPTWNNGLECLSAGVSTTPAP